MLVFVWKNFGTISVHHASTIPELRKLFDNALVKLKSWFGDSWTIDGLLEVQHQIDQFELHEAANNDTSFEYCKLRLLELMWFGKGNDSRFFEICEFMQLE